MHLARTALCCLAILALTTAGEAQRAWRPEDRLVIRDYTRMTAVAAGLDRVFAVTPEAVLTLDARTRRWVQVAEAPVPGALRNTLFALVDPLDHSLWGATRSEWFHYQPELQLWDRGPAPGGVVSIAFDRADPSIGLFLQTRGGWAIVPRTGGPAGASPPPTQPVRATRYEDALREIPSLEAFSPQFLASGRRVPARFTSAARSADGLGWFLGTDGLGLLWLDPAAIQPVRLPFGLESDRPVALFPAARGVWVLTEPTDVVGGAVTWIPGDVGEFRNLLGTFGTGLDFTRGYDLVGEGDALWAATDAGLIRLPSNGASSDVLTEGTGLPDQRVYGLAAWRGTVYAATRGGIVRVDDTLTVERIAPDFPGPAFDVAVRGDTVYAGTPQGVFAAPPGAADLERPAESMTRVEALQGVQRLRWYGDTLAALSRDALLYRAADGQWQVGPRLSSALGVLRALAPWREGFWIAGQRGVAFVTLGGGPGLALTAPGDLPGEPTDVAVEGPWLWIATLGGVVRFRLDAVQP